MLYKDSKSSFNKNQKGSALILVLLITTILLIMGTAALNISAKTRDTADLEEQKTQALYYAESGINKNIDDIKERITEYLIAKAEAEDGETVAFHKYEQSGANYRLTVTLDDEDNNIFLAVSEGFLTGKDNLQVTKTISMKFQPSDEEGEIIPSEPEEPSGGGDGIPKLAAVFEKYTVYSNGILKLNNSSSEISGDVTTNTKIHLVNSTIYGKAYLGNPNVALVFENQAKIINGTEYINPPVSIPPETDITKLKINLDSVGGTSATSADIVSGKVIENRTFENAITIEGRSNVRFNNCKFKGIVQFRNSYSNIEFNNCLFEKNLEVSSGSGSTLLNNCNINQNFSTSNGPTLYLSGTNWVGGTVSINGGYIYTPLNSPYYIDSTYTPLKGAGILIANNTMSFTNTVKANNNQQTNLAIVSLSASDQAIFNDNGNFHGVLFAPKGTIKINNGSGMVEGSVAGNSVLLENSKVHISPISQSLAELLPGTTSTGGGGNPSYEPNIAGIKVKDWKEQ